MKFIFFEGVALMLAMAMQSGMAQQTPVPIGRMCYFSSGGPPPNYLLANSVTFEVPAQDDPVTHSTSGSFTLQWKVHCNGDVAMGDLAVDAALFDNVTASISEKCAHIDQVSVLGKSQPELFLSALCGTSSKPTRMWVTVTPYDKGGKKFIGSFALFDSMGTLMTHGTGLSK